MTSRLPLAFLVATVVAAPAAAAEAPIFGATTDAIVTLGGGVRVAPQWDGAKSYMLSPMPIVGLKFLRSPLTGAPTSDTGFGIAPAFRFVPKREFDARSGLQGLDRVGATVELGAVVDYTDNRFRASVEVRRGFGGHHGVISELGLDAILHPMDHLTLSAGPRVSFASAEYMDRWYGVSAAESARTGLATHRPGAGLLGAGLAGRATWDVDGAWLVRADAAWTRLSDSAAKSPIVKADGARDQFTVGLGVARRFGFGWH